MLFAQNTQDCRAPANRIIAAAMKDSAAWNRIAELTDTFCNRLSGSAALERTIDWLIARMKPHGREAVPCEPVMVPHRVSGPEPAVLLRPRATSRPILVPGALVGSPAPRIPRSPRPPAAAHGAPPGPRVPAVMAAARPTPATPTLGSKPGSRRNLPPSHAPYVKALPVPANPVLSPSTVSGPVKTREGSRVVRYPKGTLRHCSVV